MDRERELLKLYDLFPFHEHPLWAAIHRHELTYQQVIDAEVQHWIRTRAGRVLREEAMKMAQKLSVAIFEQLMETYLEECTHDSSGPSHLDLIEGLVVQGGKNKAELERTEATPGNAAAIALYRAISDRGAGCHLVGAGAVEHFYSKLTPQIFSDYTTLYGMSEAQASTYKIHGTMDQVHAERAFSVLKEVIDLHGWDEVRRSVRDAFVATSLHYDGMLQGATKENKYWDGRRP
ncbi:MAG TPA: iron-containing redox enzyme family protein [Candidatus Dormibacteraeota bacterium]|nr:iron-containing redox enzyme family protein [Candidatus Dormibacteraeota bacterium]